MSGKLLVTGFQRAVGWCETAIRTDRSTRERLVMNQDGTARYSGQSRPDFSATWVAPRENLYLSSLYRDGRFSIFLAILCKQE